MLDDLPTRSLGSSQPEPREASAHQAEEVFGLFSREEVPTDFASLLDGTL